MANGNTLQNSIISVIALGALAYVGAEAVKSMDLTRTNKENIQLLITDNVQDDMELDKEILVLEMKLQLHEARKHEHSNTDNQLGDDQQGDTQGSDETAEGTGSQ